MGSQRESKKNNYTEAGYAASGAPARLESWPTILSEASLLRSQSLHATPHPLGVILFREYCFGRESSLSSGANSVSSAKNSVSLLQHTNARPRRTH